MRSSRIEFTRVILSDVAASLVVLRARFFLTIITTTRHITARLLALVRRISEIVPPVGVVDKRVDQLLYLVACVVLRGSSIVVVLVPVVVGEIGGRRLRLLLLLINVLVLTVIIFVFVIVVTHSLIVEVAATPIFRTVWRGARLVDSSTATAICASAETARGARLLATGGVC